jgi:hypothetical protein
VSRCGSMSSRGRLIVSGFFRFVLESGQEVRYGEACKLVRSIGADYR